MLYMFVLMWTFQVILACVDSTHSKLVNMTKVTLIQIYPNHLVSTINQNLEYFRFLISVLGDVPVVIFIFNMNNKDSGVLHFGEGLYLGDDDFTLDLVIQLDVVGVEVRNHEYAILLNIQPVLFH